MKPPTQPTPSNAPRTPIVLAVVIARAGSKGLVGKNMRPLGGRPLVAWTLDHAKAAKSVTAVVLSTDGDEILDVGRSMGVHCYKRPPERATDTATIDDGARHGVECWEAETGKTCDAVAILYANVPLRPVDLTDRAVAKLLETGGHSVQTVYPVGKMHPLWMRKLVGPGSDQLENYQPNEIYRRQDLPPVFMLNSGVLAVTRASLFAVDPAHPHAFLGTDRRAIVTGAEEVVDIDDELDLMIAQAMVDRAKGNLAKAKAAESAPTSRRERGKRQRPQAEPKTN
ncbi:MAG: acylneuraminate cytidylyltransferase family protein [Planctomycetota bacterium]|nr:acylneuraminate cytidylyltransferase family protein [Planctomycetota bacterium]